LETKEKHRNSPTQTGGPSCCVAIHVPGLWKVLVKVQVGLTELIFLVMKKFGGNCFEGHRREEMKEKPQVWDVRWGFFRTMNWIKVWWFELSIHYADLVSDKSKTHPTKRLVLKLWKTWVIKQGLKNQGILGVLFIFHIWPWRPYRMVLELEASARFCTQNPSRFHSTFVFKICCWTRFLLPMCYSLHMFSLDHYDHLNVWFRTVEDLHPAIS